MKKIYTSIILFVLSVIALPAQNLRTGYFLDGYTYRYQFNPAFQGERGFFSIPVMGRISLGVESNLALSSFLYPTAEGKMATFLHPDVSDEAFLQNIRKKVMTNINIDQNIIGAGFRIKKTYHTLDASIRGNINTTLPGELFRFMKVGGADGNTVYDFSKLAASVNAYMQLAYGFSYKINDNLSVGGRFKFLAGLTNARMNIENLSLKMSQDEWAVSGNGNMTSSSLLSTLITGEDEDFLDDMLASLKKPSFGVAFDLGAVYEFKKYFTVSASILDLGFIGWKNTNIYTMSSKPWSFKGFENIKVGSDGESGDNLTERLENKMGELKDMFQFSSPETEKVRNSMLAMTVMLGFEARMPFYDRLSFGVLGTQRIEGKHSWTEGRFSINLAPARFFSLSANYAISNFGNSLGAAINLHPKIFSIFLGVDSFMPLMKVTTNFIPVNPLNTNFTFGITCPFGKYNGRFPKKVKSEK